MSQEKQRYSVVAEFRDFTDFDKIHLVGDDVSHFDENRLAKLEELNLVVKSKSKPSEAK